MLCNRYALGVTIGAIKVSLSLLIFGVSVFSYLDRNYEAGGYAKAFPTRSVASCLLAALISSLFIFGILKKEHKLMLPWFFLCVAEIVFSCWVLFLVYFAAGWVGVDGDILCLIFLIGFCIIGLEIAIYWFSSVLYKEIRKFNENNSGSVAVKYQSESKNNYANI